MTRQHVLVRDRADGRIVQLRHREEPVKLRVCRACLRAHAQADRFSCAEAEVAA